MRSILRLTPFLFCFILASCGEPEPYKLNKEAEASYQKAKNYMDSVNNDMDKHINELQLQAAKRKLRQGK